MQHEGTLCMSHRTGMFITLCFIPRCDGQPPRGHCRNLAAAVIQARRLLIPFLRRNLYLRGISIRAQPQVSAQRRGTKPSRVVPRGRRTRAETTKGLACPGARAWSSVGDVETCAISLGVSVKPAACHAAALVIWRQRRRKHKRKAEIWGCKTRGAQIPKTRPRPVCEKC